MSSPSSFLSFLRPLGLPRASTFQRFTVPRRYAGTAAINRRPSPKRINKAKTSFSEPIQPGKKHPKPSLPRPKKENAIGSRKIGAPASNRRRVTASPGVAAELTASTSPSAPASPPPEKIPSLLPYHVARTATNHLPIYLQAKRGGNLHQTLIRKISGKVNELKQELAKSLELEGQDAVVNPVTGHIVLKGWWKPQVQQFLEKRNF
ncbi:hypothetical protein EV356DRAFT_520080 [Viridothelium virens]|uniref:Large ribosomal subunit protein mL49 n=1 Tax=Viridothelium virens TaxID=1048519 RepID=A0A6A6GXC6_VIRVR|nr:hypothetical protein EV356DRAFT_520080 [Viridothelium virens]